MQRFIYRGNFCTECGNPLANKTGWWPRVFCADCAAQLRRSQRLPGKSWPWIFMLIAASLFYLLNHHAASPKAEPIAANNFSGRALAVNAPALPVTAPESSLCGARTRKGTPCRRLVKAGERCAQHRGKPSLLNASASPRGSE